MRIQIQSHRVRLTVGTSVLFGILLALLFGFAYFTFDRLQSESADEALGNVLQAAIADAGRSDEERDLQRAVRGQRGVSVAIFNKDGSLYDSIGAVPLQNTLGSGVKFMEIELVRYKSRIIDDQNVVVGLNWEPALQNNRRLAWLLTGLWLPLTGLVAIVAWAAVGRTFRPLLDMANEAERLSGTNLAERLAIPHGLEFEELARRLNAFLNRLERGVRDQEQFVMDAAHELRTPLTILRGQLETTLLKERTSPEYRRVLEIGLDEARRMSDLIEMLLISASTSQTEAPPLDVSSIVLDATDRWRIRFANKGVTLRVDIESARIAILPTEIGSVMENLLGNALRHGPSGTICEVRLFKRGLHAELSVADQGPGIPDDLKERVFERFFRADEGRSREAGGFGIGLAVCRRIVGDRGGSAKVEDCTPTGARLRVDLPLAD